MKVEKHPNHLGCVLTYTDKNNREKNVFIARADHRQILSFGTYFKQVFNENEELKELHTENIFGLNEIPANNFYISDKYINQLWGPKLGETSSHELCNKWIKYKDYVDVHKTTGVPAVQLCRNTEIKDLGYCDLPNAEIAMRIYLMRKEIDECEILETKGTLLCKGPSGYIENKQKKDWEFKDNFATSDFIWTANEANDVMNIGVSRGRLLETVKFYRGLVIPIIELD